MARELTIANATGMDEMIQAVTADLRNCGYTYTCRPNTINPANVARYHITTDTGWAYVTIVAGFGPIPTTAPVIVLMTEESETVATYYATMGRWELDDTTTGNTTWLDGENTVCDIMRIMADVAATCVAA